MNLPFFNNKASVKWVHVLLLCGMILQWVKVDGLKKRYVSMPYSVGKSHTNLGTQIEEEKMERFEKKKYSQLNYLCKISHNNVQYNINYANIITNIVLCTRVIYWKINHS